MKKIEVSFSTRHGEIMFTKYFDEQEDNISYLDKGFEAYNSLFNFEKNRIDNQVRKSKYYKQ